MHMWDNKSHDIYFMGLKTLNCYLRKKWVFKPHIIFMGFSAPWGLLQNPMGFAWGFLWGIFSKLKSHGVGTFKFKYLKNYLKMFQFFFHKFIKNKKPHHYVLNFGQQCVWKEVRNAGKMSIPKLSVPLFTYFTEDFYKVFSLSKTS